MFHISKFVNTRCFQDDFLIENSEFRPLYYKGKIYYSVAFISDDIIFNMKNIFPKRQQ